MKKQSFLSKLKEEGKLELVEPSDNIAESYLQKSLNSLRAAQILLDKELPEESTSMAYYAMYHCLVALMRKCGIKYENHAGNIIPLKEMFRENELYKAISSAKEERIDRQYYVDLEIRESVTDLIGKAQDITMQLKNIIETLKNEDIEKIRAKFKNL